MTDTQPRPLENRIALVTGASAGIGQATARLFASQGAKLVLNARRGDKLSALEKELDDAQGVETAVCVQGDASDDKVIDRMLHTAADHFGRTPDLIVVNAGRGLGGSVTTSNQAEWEEVIRTNVLGAAKLMRAAAHTMSESLKNTDWQSIPHDIIVLGSTVGKNISPFSSMYGGSKFAVHAMAEALRRELAPKGIRVCTIAPGVVVTEFQKVAGYTDDLVAGFNEKWGPLLTGEDLAKTIAWIAGQPAYVSIGDITVRSTRQDYP